MLNVDAAKRASVDHLMAVTEEMVAETALPHLVMMTRVTPPRADALADRADIHGTLVQVQNQA